ncbi:MAG: hypothetical protein K2X02_01730 [Alphaproteobacteria bacterium]|nr:hypothetical protein [Alphaproteobacteria bacterium]
MKTKAVSQKKLTKKEFFLLMIAPLLIGALITLLSVSSANAGWRDKEEVNKSPLLQGWAEFQDKASLKSIL